MTRVDLARLSDVASGVASGTSFPGSPSTNDLFYRTDHAALFFYDGTRWMTTQLYDMFFTAPSALQSYSTTGQGNGRASTLMSFGTDLWLVDVLTTFLVAGGGSALSASHKWVSPVVKADTSNSTTTLATVNIDSGSSSVWRHDTQAIDALLGTSATYPETSASWNKTGTPGNLIAIQRITYRIVAT